MPLLLCTQAPTNFSVSSAAYVGLYISGPFGTPFEIQCPKAIAGTSYWAPLVAIHALEHPRFVIDKGSAGETRRFYRATSVSNSLVVNSYYGLRITANPGSFCLIEFAPSSSTNKWLPLAALTLSTNPYFYIDMGSAGAPPRHYGAGAPSMQFILGG